MKYVLKMVLSVCFNITGVCVYDKYNIMIKLINRILYEILCKIWF